MKPRTVYRSHGIKIKVVVESGFPAHVYIYDRNARPDPGKMARKKTRIESAVNNALIASITIQNGVVRIANAALYFKNGKLDRAMGVPRPVVDPLEIVKARDKGMTYALFLASGWHLIEIETWEREHSVHLTTKDGLFQRILGVFSFRPNCLALRWHK